MTKILYNIGIQAYTSGIKIAAFFNPKAKQWLAGRHRWQQRYRADWQRINPERKPCVWVHCASLGEFEQGRPVIESLRNIYPDVKILLTFFSPSGYEIRKNYAQADYVCYLPADKHANALTFIDLFQPKLSIFVKYEFWYHYLHTLQKRGIPTLLISAVFRHNQLFFKWYGGLFRRLLAGLTHIFTQDQASANLLQQLHLQNFTTAGDTRIDRVVQIARQATAFPIIQTFSNNYKILIIGSSWQPDEAILLPFVNQYLPDDWKVIIAPHDISANHIQQIEQGLQIPYLRYSKMTQENSGGVKVLIVDNIGMLSSLYQYGRIAYIGGGFGTGIHNTLEPITFGLPVIFGPKFQKFAEAVQLQQQGGAFAIEHLAQLRAQFDFLQDEAQYLQASYIAKQYVLENQGATAKIVEFIQKQDFLHN
ncbi:MAG: 3-deoxy-D-manno-octulosonic acid transferase [Saprospiraceae bacterium]